MGRCLGFFNLFYMLVPLLGQMCTDFGNLGDIVSREMVTGTPYLVYEEPGPVACAYQCLVHVSCLSFDYWQGECFLFSLNSSSPNFSSTYDPDFIFSDIARWPQRLAGACSNHNCSQGEKCQPDPVNNEIRCLVTGCSFAEIKNADIVNSTSSAFGQTIQAPVGSHVTLQCHPGYTQTPASAECQENGTWSMQGCYPMPASCQEVQQCDNSSVDGEFWIHLRNFQHQLVRVYCHAMDTSHPQEYITLLHPNIATYPPHQNRKCRGVLIPAPNYAIGSTEFSKISVDIQNLTVNSADHTFANGTATVLQPYGEAADCTTGHPSSSKAPCGPEGTATIDLRNTSFIVDPRQNWIPKGWQPWMNVTQVSDAVFELNCGGLCGLCKPDGDLTLAVNTDDDVERDTASTVCGTSSHFNG